MADSAAANSQGRCHPSNMDGIRMHSNASESSQIEIRSRSEVQEMYPYLTMQEIQWHQEKGADVLKILNSCKETEYKQRVINYSLKDHHQLEISSQDGGNLNIAILGNSGVGKSSTGNTILGGKIFQASASGDFVTKASSNDTCTVNNRSVTVVDTPGVHNPTANHSAALKKILRWSFLLRHGVHCFIICMNATDHRFTDQIREMLECIKPQEDSHFYNYCMLVYTNVEGPLQQCSLDFFIEEKKRYEPYKCFFEAINGRVVAINNETQIPAEQQRNREAILAMADKVVRENKERGEKELYSSVIMEKAGELHNKIANVVDNTCHQVIVNAAVEVFIHHCEEMKKLDDFQKKVLEVLLKRQECTLDETKTLKFKYDSREVVMIRDEYERQIKLLFDELRVEFNTFYYLLKNLILPLQAVKHVATKFLAVVGFRRQSYSLI